MRHKIWFVIVLALTQQACEKREFAVELAYQDVSSGLALPYAVPHPIDFFPVDSFDIRFNLPQTQARPPLIGQIKLGNTGTPIYLLLDKSVAHGRYYDLLYIDLNKDHDFKNDGPPYASEGKFILNRNRHYIEFDRVAIPYEWVFEETATEEPFLCKIYFWYGENGLPMSGRIVRQSWRRGSFEFGHQKVEVVLSDDDCNGIYDSNDRWALIPADSLGTPYLAPFYLFRNLTRLGWLGDTAFEIYKLSPRGNKVILRLKEVTWTRQEDFARDNPYALEPRRPKAAREIEWLTDYRKALRLARKLKKPLLLNFCTTWGGPCKMMAERTYKDAEVVALTDDFVVVKIDGDQHRDLVKRFKITSYPTAILLDPGGKEVSRLVGYHPAAEFAAFLKSFKNKS